MAGFPGVDVRFGKTFCQKCWAQLVGVAQACGAEAAIRTKQATVAATAVTTMPAVRRCQARRRRA